MLTDQVSFLEPYRYQDVSGGCNREEQVRERYYGRHPEREETAQVRAGVAPVGMVQGCQTTGCYMVGPAVAPNLTHSEQIEARSSLWEGI